MHGNATYQEQVDYWGLKKKAGLSVGNPRLLKGLNKGVSRQICILGRSLLEERGV